MIDRIKSRLEEEMYNITVGMGEPVGVYEFCERLLAFIRTLEPEPESVDRAAADCAMGTHLAPYTDKDIRAAFKTGVNWLAERGRSMDGRIKMAFLDTGELFSARLVVDQDKLRDAVAWFSPDEEVVVQIRSKE